MALNLYFQDLELDPMDSDDFCTESDDQGKERLRLEAEERRQRYSHQLYKHVKPGADQATRSN